MKNLRRYIGRIVKLRPACLAPLLQGARLKKAEMENRFLVAAASGGKLVCYGANLRFLVSPSDVVLV